MKKRTLDFGPTIGGALDDLFSKCIGEPKRGMPLPHELSPKDLGKNHIHITQDIFPVSEDSREIKKWLKFCVECRKFILDGRELEKVYFPGKEPKKGSVEWVKQQVLNNLKKRGIPCE